jgi:hypothetical protein
MLIGLVFVGIQKCEPTVEPIDIGFSTQKNHQKPS